MQDIPLLLQKHLFLFHKQDYAECNPLQEVPAFIVSPDANVLISANAFSLFVMIISS
jgi:hypothetical protein